MNADYRLIEELALTAHGCLVGGHVVSAVYNARRARGVDRWVIWHLLAAAVSLWAVHEHHGRLKRP